MKYAANEKVRRLIKAKFVNKAINQELRDHGKIKLLGLKNLITKSGFRRNWNRQQTTTEYGLRTSSDRRISGHDIVNLE